MTITQFYIRDVVAGESNNIGNGGGNFEFDAFDRLFAWTWEHGRVPFLRSRLTQATRASDHSVIYIDQFYAVVTDQSFPKFSGTIHWPLTTIRWLRGKVVINQIGKQSTIIVIQILSTRAAAHLNTQKTSNSNKLTESPFYLDISKRSVDQLTVGGPSFAPYQPTYIYINLL